VRYRYYISRMARHGGSGAGVRIPASEIEHAVTQVMVRALNDPLALAASMRLPITPADLHQLTSRATALSGMVAKGDRDLLREIVAQVRVLADTVEVDLAVPALAARLQLGHDPDAPATLTQRTDLRLTRTGRAVRLVQGDGLAAASRHDPALIALVIKARRWWDILQQGEISVGGLAAREGVSPSWISRVLRLAFLAPPVVEALLAGRLRVGVDGAVLTATNAIDMSWKVQQRFEPLSDIQRNLGVSATGHTFTCVRKTNTAQLSETATVLGSIPGCVGWPEHAPSKSV
jgi:site-specific DNA recombinase